MYYTFLYYQNQFLLVEKAGKAFSAKKSVVPVILVHADITLYQRIDITLIRSLFSLFINTFCVLLDSKYLTCSVCLWFDYNKALEQSLSFFTNLC